MIDVSYGEHLKVTNKLPWLFVWKWQRKELFYSFGKLAETLPLCSQIFKYYIEMFNIPEIRGFQQDFLEILAV